MVPCADSKALFLTITPLESYTPQTSSSCFHYSSFVGPLQTPTLSLYSFTLFCRFLTNSPLESYTPQTSSPCFHCSSFVGPIQTPMLSLHSFTLFRRFLINSPQSCLPHQLPRCHCTDFPFSPIPLNFCSRCLALMDCSPCLLLLVGCHTLDPLMVFAA